MNFLVLASLIPVVLLIATGFLAARMQWLRADSVKDISTLVFMALTPALMFRSMGKVDVAHLNLLPIAAYFSATLLLFFAVVAWGRATRHAAAMAISASFGNTVAIGVPLVSLAYGEQALVTLLTIVSVHALILLTLTTVVFELAVARENGGSDDNRLGGGLVRQVASAVKNGIVNPSTLPTLLGLAFGQTGWVLPTVIDRTLQLLASAMVPLALIVVGASLARSHVGREWRPALVLTLLKNIVLPLLVAVSAWMWGLRGTSLVIVVIAACMPVGANAFMFSQRYNVAQQTVTAAVALSTGAALATVSLAMAGMAAFGW